MKTIKNIVAVLATTSLLICCSDDGQPSATGQGALDLEFDNVFAGNDLTLGSQPNMTSQGETLRVDRLKYIVSNIVLTRADGSTFRYPKSQSYFIVDEADEASRVLHLENIPAGDYVAVQFGIGVDEQQWELGADGQGDLLQLAQDEDMLASWSEGYTFLLFEGRFTSPTVSSETAFVIRTGKAGADYNYATVDLPMPNRALVRTTITPEVHIFADASRIIDGENTLVLSENNAAGTGAMITDGANLALITANLSQMFSVNHVHND